MTLKPRRGHQPWYLRFHDLMPHRVREVLLVSSPYDAFILEQDGQLTARVFQEYSNLDLSQAPRITHAISAEHALTLLNERHFDMVITMLHLAGMDVSAFARQVKVLDGRMPVVVFAFSEAELSFFATEIMTGDIDRVFVWTGDTRVLVAAIKLLEDQMNVDHDTRASGVRVIIVVEDSTSRYSSFLSLFYGELLQQAGSLIAEGLNDLHKRLRMRARPRVLLATNFEEAMAYYEKYQRYVFGVISDVRFPRDGQEVAEAGFDLVRIIRQNDPDLPILLQSAEQGLQAHAEELHVSYAEKTSLQLARQIRHFLQEGLGFGDFVFRLPDRTEVGRARDVYDMERQLPNVPVESIEFHANSNHFSVWLMARSMLRLAERLRPRRVDEFKDAEAMRQHLIAVLREARMQERQGAITDFTARKDETETPFVRLGKGSIGGKGRGIAFANSLIVRHGLDKQYPEMRVRIPRTVAIGTDEFDRFVVENDLEDLRKCSDDREIIARFLRGRLSEEVLRDLKMACLWEMKGPLAVRSSSLLEDSLLHSFAGIYATYMLPNNHPDPSVRLRELCRAVKAVYASTYCQEARAYAGLTFPVDEEKMGVVIQECVGAAHGERFYPNFAGVALSYNYYPFGPQQAEEGIVAVALGLGQMVVSGGNMLQFSPASPQILPQFPSPQHFLKYSQTEFFAVDLGRPTVDFFAGPDSSVGRFGLKMAEQDGTLSAVGSVYRPNDDTIQDTLREKGPRVVTFNNVLKWESIPLAAALGEILEVLEEGIGQPVEVEFAVDMGDWGRNPSERKKRRDPCLYILQVRPQATRSASNAVLPKEVPQEFVFSRTSMALGHGIIDDITDILYVKEGVVSEVGSREVAQQVGAVNEELRAAGRPYLLVGPGRWGSSDPFLGIPVHWRQISGARVIVETPFEGRCVEPSQGSHFFHNITTRSVGYLTLAKPPGGGGVEPSFDRAWVQEQPLIGETSALRHVRLKAPLTVYIDAHAGQAVIHKPNAPTPGEVESSVIIPSHE
ncbi:MAG: histidine kinase [Deltaproteobacteria bacterium]|nr:histidine kinase [Deltaproteobacteria bacterium]